MNNHDCNCMIYILNIYNIYNEKYYYITYRENGNVIVLYISFIQHTSKSIRTFPNKFFVDLYVILCNDIFFKDIKLIDFRKNNVIGIYTKFSAKSSFLKFEFYKLGSK